MKYLLIGFLRLYRLLISPLYGQVCRYYPSCSEYALDAVRIHGSIRGSWLAVCRLARCHPWAPGGVDKVPPRKERRARFAKKAHRHDQAAMPDAPDALDMPVPTAPRSLGV